MNRSWRQRLRRLPDPDLIPGYRFVWGALAVVVALVSAGASLVVFTPGTAALAIAASFGMVFTVAALYAVAFERPWWSPVTPSFVASILFVQWVVLLMSVGWFALLLVLLVATAPRLLSMVHWQLATPDEQPGRPTLRELARGRAWRDVDPEDARWTWGDQW